MAKDKPGNQTAGTPDLSETELREMKIDDLRERARKEGVSGASSMRKEELVDAISALHRKGGGSGKRSGNGSGNGSRNDAPDTPGLSETELREMKLDDLRERAREEGLGGASSMKKEELVKAISARYREGGAGSAARGGREGGEPTEQDLAEEEVGAPGDKGPDKGRMRTGSESSKSLKYSQEITSLDDDPERAGRSLVTTSHEVIRSWAEERGGVPATVEGTEHGDRAGVLRFDFGERTDKLRHITWEEWFRTFDERRLNFLYQEERKDGRQSTFFRLENPEREDA
jgi:hypothetical protein